jgi:IS1 family transposase/transposase-like protein
MRKPQDWGQCCPNPDCLYYTQMSRGNVSSISTYLTGSGKRRIFHCSKCEKNFSETRDTVFFDLKTTEEKVMMALKMILVKVDLAGISFVLGVKEETVLEWLRRAAEKAAEINAALMKELAVTQVQLDEMWSFIRRKHAAEIDDYGEGLPDSEDGRQWIWLSYAPEYRLILSAYVGPRTYESALQLIQMTAAIVTGIPCFFSDGFSCYLTALIAVYHTIKRFKRTGKPGRPRKPILKPLKDLVYAQVVKVKKQGRLKEIQERVLCGARRLKKLGLSISTSLIERVNLTFRHSLAPLVRKSYSFCKDREQMRRRVLFFQTFYNFARPHMSLRLPLSQKDQFRVGLIRHKWTDRSPAMAAGISHHLWSFRELLTIKFEKPVAKDYQSISG